LAPYGGDTTNQVNGASNNSTNGNVASSNDASELELKVFSQGVSSVIVQESPDMLNWQEVSTNSVANGTNTLYVTSNLPRAHYRVKENK